MIRSVVATVESLTVLSPGAQEARVSVCDPATGFTTSRKAINLVELTGEISIGERVLINTVAVELGLGTGGVDFVIARLDRERVETTPQGHVLKLRYTPLQVPILAAEAQESVNHSLMQQFDTLNETPVVCAELHSQLPAICAGAAWHLEVSDFPRTPRIVYVMTPGASLPIAFSRLVPALKEKGWLTATVTSGQAFGGDFEAVNLYSALGIAKEVAKADIIVTAQGPGNVGTETPFGFSGIEQGEALNAVGALGGTAIMAPRISFADPRSRHQGVSHHTLTILKRVVHIHAWVALPRFRREIENETVRNSFEDAHLEERYDFPFIEANSGYEALENSGLNVTTMGRSLSQDSAFFLTAVAAGILAGQCADDRR